MTIKNDPEDHSMALEVKLIGNLQPQGLRLAILDRLEITIPVIVSSFHRVFGDPALLKILKVIILGYRNSALRAFP